MVTIDDLVNSKTIMLISHQYFQTSLLNLVTFKLSYINDLRWFGYSWKIMTVGLMLIFLPEQNFLHPQLESAHRDAGQFLSEVCPKMPRTKSSGRSLSTVVKSLLSAKARRTSATSVSARSSWLTRPCICQVPITHSGCYNPEDFPAWGKTRSGCFGSS